MGKVSEMCLSEDEEIYTGYRDGVVSCGLW